MGHFNLSLTGKQDAGHESGKKESASGWVISAREVGKVYPIYSRPIDRLMQTIYRGRKKFYKEFWALTNLNFDIQARETVGIIGSNGSGKSTLLQIICGILNPSSGSIKTSGRISALLELGAGFNPDFTGRENVFMNAAIMGLSRKDTEKRIDAVEEFADIGDFIDRPVKTYSSGMFVRLAFAAAINVSPDILVVDEALAVGDARFSQKCMIRIREFCETGTVIIVSHDTHAVTELCSRVLWIESGRIRMDGSPRHVTEKYLEYMYEGDKETAPSSEAGKTPASGLPDIKGFTLIKEDARQFGKGQVQIRGLRIGPAGGGNGVVYSGQECEIAIWVEAMEAVEKPIVGYLVKDRFGRELMGDNTSLMHKPLPRLKKGSNYLLSFFIPRWPNIFEQDYTLSIAVADGERHQHIQCHYIHDAAVFKSIPERVPGGFFSVSDTEFDMTEFAG